MPLDLSQMFSVVGGCPSTSDRCHRISLAPLSFRTNILGIFAILSLRAILSILDRIVRRANDRGLDIHISARFDRYCPEGLKMFKRSIIWYSRRFFINRPYEGLSLDSSLPCHGYPERRASLRSNRSRSKAIDRLGSFHSPTSHKHS